MEGTIDSQSSLILPPSTVPILSIRQVHTIKLGEPYSECVRLGDHYVSLILQ